MKPFCAYSSFVFLVLAALLYASCNNSSDKTINESLAAKINRGDYLVNTVCNCMHCHGTQDFTKFSGPIIPGTEGKGGKPEDKGIYTSNITPAVLGSWTDVEIVRAITTGLTKSGDTLFPLMPYIDYMYMSKEDAASIAAYLRTLKPIADSVPKRNLAAFPPGILTSLYQSLYIKNAGKENPQRLSDDKIARGDYLVKLGSCNSCHTPFDWKFGVFKNDSVLAGGSTYHNPGFNFTVRSANLTPDSATGIGTWTEEIFLAKFKNFRDQKAYGYNPGKHNTDMPWSILAKMTDDDIKSIYSYLRTIKPVNNKVEKWP